MALSVWSGCTNECVPCWHAWRKCLCANILGDNIIDVIEETRFIRPKPYSGGVIGSELCGDSIQDVQNPVFIKGI